MINLFSPSRKLWLGGVSLRTSHEWYRSKSSLSAVKDGLRKTQSLDRPARRSGPRSLGDNRGSTRSRRSDDGVDSFRSSRPSREPGSILDDRPRDRARPSGRSRRSDDGVDSFRSSRPSRVPGSSLDDRPRYRARPSGRLTRDSIPQERDIRDERKSAFRRAAFEQRKRGEGYDRRTQPGSRSINIDLNDDRWRRSDDRQSQDSRFASSVVRDGQRRRDDGADQHEREVYRASKKGFRSGRQSRGNGDGQSASLRSVSSKLDSGIHRRERSSRPREAFGRSRRDEQQTRDVEPDQSESLGFKSPNSSRDVTRSSPAEPSSNADRATSEDPYTSIPYTTASSEFLYGINPVLAALTTRRREFHKLYLHRASLVERATRAQLLQIQRLAAVKRVPVHNVTHTLFRTLDKMTSGRSHNGVVLECSPIPAPIVTSLSLPDPITNAITMELKDAAATAPSSDNTLKPPSITTSRPHKPLIVLLDGVLDPGNVGNIVRSAYFFGATAVAICTNTCAPISSAVVAKASAGAVEAIPILSIKKPADFIRLSRSKGWDVYASASAPEAGEKKDKTVLLTNSMTSPLLKTPGILMLGAEGEGLRKIMREKANFELSISGAGKGKPDIGVDSLNVASAAAVLLEALMRGN